MMRNENIYFLKLKNFIQKHKLDVNKIEPLTPDASTRRYFRLHFSHDKTKIAMVMGETDRRIVFEEILEKQIKFQELPFVNVGRFLKKNGINVPEIYVQGEDVLLLEDFGNTPLDVFVKEKGIYESIPYYISALEELAKMQRVEPDGKCYAFEIYFSKNMFLWEFNHFTEYFMGFRLEEDKEMMEEFSHISERISGVEYVFTHRDFHSKNLMCLENFKVGLLDFQDALLAPYTYDLVSLTADAYVDMPDEVEVLLVERYKDLTGRKTTSPDEFEEIYSMTAAQRALKAAGRFMYIFREKGNSKFIPYVIPAASKGVKYLEKLRMKSAGKIRCEIEKKRDELEPCCNRL